MTIPKRLQEKRDELISEKKEPYNDTYKPLVGAMIELGFDSACDLLLPEIQKLREALLRLTVRLEESASIHDIKPSAEIVKQALKSWQEFLNGK